MHNHFPQPFVLVYDPTLQEFRCLVFNGEEWQAASDHPLDLGSSDPSHVRQEAAMMVLT
jgi:hypothetical protein